MESAQQRAERVKAMLSQYYGSSGPAQPSSAPGSAPPSATKPSLPRQSPGPAGQSSIDTASFNAESHIANVLRTSTLEKLMVEHRNMAREIKNLNSDMQQLVYENYNKFMTATDTIKVMKSSIDALSPEMTRLKALAGEVTESTLSVSSKLEARSSNMEQLYKVQQLLKKLQAVFDLPKRMRAALEEDALDAAVGLYAEAQPLLHKYGAKGTFRMIAVESDFVAQEISQLLRRRLAERKDDTEQCVLLLRKLGEPDDTLQDQYLGGRARRIRRVLAEATAVADAMSLAAMGQAVTLPGRGKVEAPETWGLEGGTVPSLRTFIKALDEKFINALSETASNVNRFFLQDAPPATQPPSQPQQAQNHSSSSTASDKAMPQEQWDPRRRPLLALANDTCNEYFAIVRRVVMDAARASVQHAVVPRVAPTDPTTGAPAALPPLLDQPVEFREDWGAEAIAQTLLAVSTDVGLLSNTLRELGLRAKATDLLQVCVRHHVGLCFLLLKQQAVASASAASAAMQDTCAQRYDASSAADSAAHPILKRGYAHLTGLLRSGLAAALIGLKGYESFPRLLAPWREEWADAVQGGLQAFFTGLLVSFMDLARCKYDGSDLLRQALKGGGTGGPTATPPPPSSAAAAAAASDPLKPGLVLLLAKVCSFLEQSVVPWVMEHIAAAFAGGAGHRDTPPAFVPGEVARRFNAASSALVAKYVETHGRQLSIIVRRSVAGTNWLAAKEPREPRPLCDVLLERMGRVEAEVGQLLEDPGRGPPDAALGGVGMSARSARSYADPQAALEAGNVARNVAKLFREKVQIFGAVGLSSGAILAAVCGVGLKSFMECIRLQTLGRAGLQQLQLDMAYLKPGLCRYARGANGGARGVEGLIEEVVAAGVERCVEPSLLEAAVLERIVATLSTR